MIPTPRAERSDWLASLLFGLLLVLGFWLLQPGVSGSFQLDDNSNLGPLEALNNNPTADQLAQFVLKGIASPLGRPLSLLSFALQAPDWPDHAGSFIRFNILLHLLNGALLFWCLLRLARLCGASGTARTAIPLAATALWLLAPIQISSVLYVVQRMTALSATFVFLGMGLYLVGREALHRGERLGGLAWMSLGLGVGAGLGTLAKENAAQMPLMVLALEFTLLAGLERPRAWKVWAVPFLALPAVALLTYLVWVGITATGYYGRDFTPAERLLTEPRVLFMYMHKMLAPWPSAVRLWYDDFPVSRGLLDPWTTAVALPALLAVVAAAWRFRRAAALPAFAVFWFLACHVIESSTVPLELVFEHRNYQASVGVWFALAAGAHRVISKASSAMSRRVFVTLAAAYLGLQAIVTWQIASLWGRPLELSAWMAYRLPDSKRAALNFSGTLVLHRRPFEAAAQASLGAQRWPDDASFPLVTLALSCQVRAIPFPDTPDLMRRLRAATGNVNAIVNHADNVLSLVEAGHCPLGLPLALSKITAVLVTNPALHPQRQNLLLLHSRSLAVEKRPAEARAAFRQAIDVRPQMILLIQGVLDGVSDGDLAQAHYYLERARSDPRIKPQDRWAHRNDITLLEQLLRSREGKTPPQ